MSLSGKRNESWGADPPGFPVRLGGVKEAHAAFLKESRTRCHGWGHAVGNAGSFAPFAKGGIPRISLPTVAYPTLCKERKGWGTRLFVVLPAVPNTNRGLTEDLFFLRKPHTRLWPGPRSRKSGSFAASAKGGIQRISIRIGDQR